MPLKKLKRAAGKVLGGAKKVVRKVVPKEVAGIMTAAAPFVAPYSLPAAAALSIGGQLRTGQGRINPFITGASLLPGIRFAGGAGLGAFKPTGFARFGQDFGPSTQVGLRGLLFGQGPGQTGQLGQFGETAEKFLFGSPVGGEYDKATQGIFGKGGEYGFTKGSLIRKADGTLNKTNIAAMAASGFSLATATKQIEEEAIEEGASDSEIAALTAEAADFWSTLSSEDFKVTPTLAQGGRVGFQDGTDVSPTIRSEKMANYKALSEPLDYGRQLPPFLKRTPIKYEQSRDDFETMQKERFMYNYDKPKMSEKMLNKIRNLLDKDDRQASADPMTILNQMAIDMFNKPLSELTDREREMIMSFMKPNAKKGGLMRQNLALGTRPTAQESGLGGLPIEADMRYSGGFMPYGAREKADDVPARLSKNEFVFTADAVRAAGGGSVQKGAQKMYNTMKQLEAMGRA